MSFLASFRSQVSNLGIDPAETIFMVKSLVDQYACYCRSMVELDVVGSGGIFCRFCLPNKMSANKIAALDVVNKLYYI